MSTKEEVSDNSCRSLAQNASSVVNGNCRRAPPINLPSLYVTGSAPLQLSRALIIGLKLCIALLWHSTVPQNIMSFSSAHSQVLSGDGKGDKQTSIDLICVTFDSRACSHTCFANFSFDCCSEISNLQTTATPHVKSANKDFSCCVSAFSASRSTETRSYGRGKHVTATTAWPMIFTAAMIAEPALTEWYTVRPSVTASTAGQACHDLD